MSTRSSSSSNKSPQSESNSNSSSQESQSKIPRFMIQESRGDINPPASDSVTSIENQHIFAESDGFLTGMRHRSSSNAENLVRETSSYQEHRTRQYTSPSLKPQLEMLSPDATDFEDPITAALQYAAEASPITYASKRRNMDFHKLFPNVPTNDRLIEDYACAWQKEILLQGRIYISQHHFSFYANIIGWVHEVTIPIRLVIGIEKKNIVGFIPNSIQIDCPQEKYFFASFLQRDATFGLMFRLWKHPFNNEILPLIPTIHSASNPVETFGDVIEEMVQEQTIVDRSESLNNSNASKAVDSNAAMASPWRYFGLGLSAKAENAGIQPSSELRKRGGVAEKSTSGFIEEKPSTADMRQTETKSLPSSVSIDENMDEISPSIAPTLRMPTTCPCKDHEKMILVMDQIFDISVSEMWLLLFGNKSTHNGLMKKFSTDVRKSWDIMASKWHSSSMDVKNISYDLDEKSEEVDITTAVVGLKRKLTSTTPLTNPMGPKQATTNTTEEIKQVSNKKEYICVRSVSETPDVPAGNCFRTHIHTCLTDNGGLKDSVRVRISCSVDFYKFSFIQSFITNAVPEGMKEHYNQMNAFIRTEFALRGDNITSGVQSQDTTQNVVLESQIRSEDAIIPDPSNKISQTALPQALVTISIDTKNPAFVQAIYVLVASLFLFTLMLAINTFYLMRLYNLRCK